MALRRSAATARRFPSTSSHSLRPRNDERRQKAAIATVAVRRAEHLQTLQQCKCYGLQTLSMENESGTTERARVVCARFASATQTFLQVRMCMSAREVSVVNGFTTRADGGDMRLFVFVQRRTSKFNSAVFVFYFSSPIRFYNIINFDEHLNDVGVEMISIVPMLEEVKLWNKIKLVPHQIIFKTFVFFTSVYLIGIKVKQAWSLKYETKFIGISCFSNFSNQLTESKPEQF